MRDSKNWRNVRYPVHTRYFVLARPKTGPDKILELSAHRTEDEAKQAAEIARQNDKWEYMTVSTAGIQS